MRTLKFMDKTVDYPSWQKLLLSEVADWYNGYAFKPSDLSNNGTPVIKIKEILDDTNLDVKTQISDIPENNRISHGDLILSWSMTIATKIWNKQDAYLNQHLYKVKPKDVTFEYFLKYALDSIKSEIKLKMHGGIAKHITRKDLLNLTVSLPSLPEQEKIAGFLGALDERIRVQEEIIEKLKDQKQGYHQKIFGRELRFRDEQGNPYPEWETKKLGEVADIVGGGTPSTDREEFWNGDILWITPAEVKGKYINSSKRKITLDGLANSSAKILPIGSIILTSRATLGEMSILQIPSSTNQGFQSLIPKKVTTTNFLYALQNQIKKYCDCYSAGSTFREISKKEISKMKIPFPSYFEQVKIGNFFEKLDDRIAIEDILLQNLQSKKRSYMQKMF